MPVLHDLECTKCGRLQSNALVMNTSRLPKCGTCGAKTVINWMTNERRVVQVAAKERSVVWMNRKTGSVATPPVNNVDMPARYKNNGYERVEFTNVHQLDRYCKERKLVNEGVSFDKNGHADDL